MSYDKRMKILSKLDSIDPAEALTAYPRIAEYDAITKLPISRRRGKNNMSMKRLQIWQMKNLQNTLKHKKIVH